MQYYQYYLGQQRVKKILLVNDCGADGLLFIIVDGWFDNEVEDVIIFECDVLIRCIFFCSNISLGDELSVLVGCEEGINDADVLF